MRRRVLAVAGISALLASCQAESFQRVSLEREHLSLRVLKGWESERSRGSVVLRGPGSATIVIRSVSKDDPRSGHRTDKDIQRATEAVLRRYRKGTLEGPRPVEDAKLEAIAYDLTFLPRGKSRRYERTHVVLFGSQRVFHLWHTAPEGELEKTEGAFDALVQSAREEG